MYFILKYLWEIPPLPSVGRNDKGKGQSEKQRGGQSEGKREKSGRTRPI